MSEQQQEFPHIYLPENGERADYQRPSQGGGDAPIPPNRDRMLHAQLLEQSIDVALQEARQQLESRDPNIAAGTSGFYLEFEVKADPVNAFEKLESRQQKIELVATKKLEEEGLVSATVFVPERATDEFLRKVEKYRNEDTSKGKPKNEALVSRIESVQLAKVKSLFTDNSSLFPGDEREVWWEVWLRNEPRLAFNQVTQRLEIRTKPHSISFPEREVVLAMCNVEAMARIISNSDAIAELRIAKDIPTMFLEMGSLEQTSWTEDLADRLVEPDHNAVSICLLDSGISQAHPLLSLALTADDVHTVDPSWGVNDNPNRHGHGTAMAGIALYSDLFHALETSESIVLLHRLESVKILPRTGENDPEVYGWITGQGVYQPEIQAPERRRIFCMAVTSDIEATDNGTPSSWSAAVDQLCFNDGKFRRLMIISAGNITQDIRADDYLAINDITAVENPAQAWNPLIVGAYTEKINILDPDYDGWQPLARGGDLSPRSRTSVIWESQWPIRPDVVFEGGNMAHDGQNTAEPINDLCLLTTHYRPNIRMFDYMGDTSCATALASHMAASIMSEYPTFSPETVRALIVHSAEWTPTMFDHFNRASSKTARGKLVRRYGYGVPNLKRALQSAKNHLTLIAEDCLQPFSLEDRRIKTKDMKLHKFPWPSEKLEELGEVDVELRVTLSYFIEPNPGERGWGYKHRYASHGLRFKVKSSLETYDEFKWRINEAARRELENRRNLDTSSEENKWFLGSNTRDCGSIHCDIWKGTAAELSQKDAVAVFPIGGWWKDKKYLEKYNQVSHYSLIVSIRVPEVDVDIYTPVSELVSLDIMQPV